jgi:hypothetical protein
VWGELESPPKGATRGGRARTTVVAFWKIRKLYENNVLEICGRHVWASSYVGIIVGEISGRHEICGHHWKYVGVMVGIMWASSHVGVMEG